MIPVIYVCVMSADGYTTRHDEARILAWTSREDQAYFTHLLQQHSAIIMGRKTYEVAHPWIRPSTAHQRYIYTTHPEQFADLHLPGQREFTSEAPLNLLGRLEQRGHKQALLVGGAGLGKTFLEQHLITELWLTIEPRIFGTGHPLFTPIATDVSLQLLDLHRWNEQGTLFARYQLKY